MSSRPIACSLSASDLASVKERYLEASSDYRATARIIDDHADISLTGDKAALQELLAEMIVRENACCPFLTFGVHGTATGFDVRLDVRDADGIERGILREMVAALFPVAVLAVP